MNIYLFRGKSASGKTTMSDILSKKYNIPVLRKDDIFDAMSKHTSDKNIINASCYDTLAAMLQTCIDNNSDVIVDIALPDISNFESFLAKINFKDANIYGFFCDCSNKQVWNDRIQQRLENPKPNQYFKSVNEITEYYDSLSIKPARDEIVLDSALPKENLMQKIDMHIQKPQTPSIIEILWKLILIVFASIGVYLQARDDGGLFRNHTFLYFTIISNMGTAILFLIFFIAEVLERFKKKTCISKRLFTVKYIFTTAMTVTLVVSAVFLAPFKDNTYLFSMKNLSLHIFAPLITVIDFLIFDRRFVFKWKTLFLGFVLPILYLTITLLLSIRGISYSNGTNYPYYFLDYRSLGWLTFGGGQLGVLWWILIISVIVLIVSTLLTALKKIIFKICK